MKKTLIIWLCLLFLPFIVYAETCESDKVTIESIEISSKTDNVIEKSKPEINGKNINLNLKMKDIGDTIEYKMVFKNNSKEDYELDKTSLSASSDYIEYIFNTNDKSNIIKSGEEKEVLLKVQYKNEVSDDSFVNGIYNDSKNLLVNLSAGERDIPNPIKNPNTSIQSYLLIVSIILIISLAVLITLKRKKYNKFMILIIGIAIIIPISVNAICKCEIKLNSDVEIIKPQQFKIRIVNCDEWINDYFEFDYGMTLEEWVNSNYINSIVQRRIDQWDPQYGEIDEESTRTQTIDNLLFYFTVRMGYDTDYVIQPNDFLDYYSPEC